MIIDGKKISEKHQKRLAEKIEKLHIKPSLTFILVGKDPASHTYVKMKQKACQRVGMHSEVIELPETILEEELLARIDEINENPNIHGLLVQMPLPKKINPYRIFEAIHPLKDVDCFHPTNVGKLFLGERSGFIPCTPLGISILLEEAKISTVSKHVVILGRSNIVGKPLAALLIHKGKEGNATVTIAHSKTKNLKEITLSADILVAAIGKGHFVTKDMVKPGAVVIDVGTTRILKNNKKELIGDVDFASVKEVASHITPVPGGVGPMTITALLENTFKAYSLQQK